MELTAIKAKDLCLMAAFPLRVHYFFNKLFSQSVKKGKRDSVAQIRLNWNKSFSDSVITRKNGMEKVKLEDHNWHNEFPIIKKYPIVVRE